MILITIDHLRGEDCCIMPTWRPRKN